MDDLIRVFARPTTVKEFAESAGVSYLAARQRIYRWRTAGLLFEAGVSPGKRGPAAKRYCTDMRLATLERLRLVEGEGDSPKMVSLPLDEELARVQKHVPEEYLAAITTVNDTLDLAFKSAQQVFGPRATPEHALAVYDRIAGHIERERKKPGGEFAVKEDAE